MKRLTIPAALFILSACQSPAPEAPAAVVVTDAICRPTPNGRNVSACYLTLTASRADRLVSVATPLAGVAQVHEMSTEGGVMRMGELENGLPLPAGEAVALKPGGAHIMLMDVKTALAIGDAAPLTLTFEHAAPLDIRATVGQPALENHSAGH